MKRITALLLLPIVLLLVAFTLSKKREEPTIPFDVNHPLTWNDFKGKAPKRSAYSAKTNSGYTFSMELVEDSFLITLPCFFYPKTSWVKKKDKNAELLQHEQGHFDLTELHCRKMRAAIQQGNFKLKTISKDIQKIITRENKLLVKEQGRYDEETNHSIVAEKQKQWNKYLEKNLSNYQNAASFSFKIGFKR